jgi:hypothetical protein
MNTLELKGSIFEKLAQIENDQELIEINDFLDAFAKEDSDLNFWNNYTPEQKQDLMTAFEESYDVKNWVEHEDVIKKYRSNAQ